MDLPKLEERSAMKRLYAVLIIAMSLGAGRAQAGPTRFVAFQNFVETTREASFGDYAARPESRVKDAAAFEEMRRHVLSMYEGVQVTHSFVLDSDHYDCVPIEQQPSVRLLGLKSIASPPPLTALNREPMEDVSAADGLIQSATQFGVENSFDEFGNSTACEEDTVSLRRVTLEDMTRFPNLQQFFEKSPNEEDPCGAEPADHKYSITCQKVDNLGGNSALNLWAPVVDTSGDIFSLSQEWYTGGTGTGFPGGMQTLEVGWVVWPHRFGDSEDARLFIFSTRDGYRDCGTKDPTVCERRTGCWNSSCGDFVQIGQVALGGGFTNYSVTDGVQFDFEAEFYIFEKNMWLAINGVWVGYYPESLYCSPTACGQLTKHATFMEFGSESYVEGSNATTVWPKEGSGEFSKGGFRKAAYQRDLYYLTNTSGGFLWDSLPHTQELSPHCYTITGPTFGTDPGWEVYFYEGGPGGSNCGSGGP